MLSNPRVDEPGATAMGSEINLACFAVAEQRYALEVIHVREVVRRGEITPLPNAPALIEGVVELRDSVIPVVDLGRALGHAPTQPTASSRVAVVELDGMVFGLCVDRATEVLAVGSSDLRDPPTLAVQAGYEAVKAVVRRPDSVPVLVLSLEHILESVYRSALSSLEES
jgi:purine-binding chemotaxis protein CheW